MPKGSSASPLDLVLLCAVGGLLSCGSPRPLSTSTVEPQAASSADPQQTASVVVEAQSPAIVDGELKETVGVETLGGVLTPLLSPGCRIPCVSAEIFSTSSDGQSAISISYFRGNVAVTRDAHALGLFRIEGIPPMPRGAARVEVVLTASSDSLLVEAHDASSKAPVRILRVP